MNEHLKYAYQLGVEKAAAEAGLTKEAFLGKALWGLGKGLWGAVKGVGKPLWRTGAAAIEKPLAGAGRAIGKRIMPHLSPGGRAWLGAATRTIPREAGMFGLLGGGMGAAMAPEGERLEGTLRGLAGGVLGGAGWGAARGLSRYGLARGMKSVVGGKGMSEVARRARMPLLSTLAGKGVAGGKLAPGEMGKILGTKALLGGVPLALGLGASMHMPTFEKHPYATLGATGLGRAFMEGRALPPSLARRLPAFGFAPQTEMVYR